MNDEPRTLRVLPNPYAALDAKGRPIAAVAREGNPESFIGGQVATALRNKLGKLIVAPAGMKLEPTTTLDDIAEAWRTMPIEPVVVPETPMYQRLIQDGSLIAADEETARNVGLRQPTDEHVGGIVDASDKKAKAPRPRDYHYGEKALAHARELAMAAHEARTAKAPPAASEQKLPREAPFKEYPAETPKERGR